jgi:hypothetical protein
MLDGHLHAAVGIAAGGRTRGALLVAREGPVTRTERALLDALGIAAGAAVGAVEQAAPNEQQRREGMLATLHDVAFRLLAPAEPKETAGRACAELLDLARAELVVLLVREAGARGAVVAASAGAAPRARPQPDTHGWLDLTAPRAQADRLALPFELPGGARGLLLADRCRHPLDLAALHVLGSYLSQALGSSRELAATRRQADEGKHAASVAASREARLRETARASAELVSASLTGDGLNVIVETLGRLVRAPAAIYDSYGSRLAGHTELPAQLAELVSRAPEEDVAELSCGSAIAVIAGGERFGWLLVDTASGSVEPDVVAFATTSAAIALSRERAAEEAEARVRGDFAEALLACEQPSETLIRRGRALGHDPTQPSQIAVARVDEHGGPDLHRLAIGWAHHTPGVLLAERADELVAIGPAGDSWARELHTLLAAAGEVRIGVGEATATSGYRRSYQGASRAAAALSRLGRSGLIWIDGDGLEQLLLRAADPAILAAFVQRVLDPLSEYDRRRNADLRRTLELCIEHVWNIQASARAAHLHHSTLRYRLRRIASLTGLDPSRAEDRLAFQLALLADRLLHD